jgi:hypothetical protein
MPIIFFIRIGVETLLTLLTWDSWGGVSRCNEMIGGNTEKPKRTTRNNDSRRYGGPQRKQYVSTTLRAEVVHHVRLAPYIPLSYLSFVQYCALPLPGLHSAAVLHFTAGFMFVTPMSRSSSVDIFLEQCCGSGMFIQDPTFSISDPGSASKNLSILTQKNGF